MERGSDNGSDERQDRKVQRRVTGTMYARPKKCWRDSCFRSSIDMLRVHVTEDARRPDGVHAQGPLLPCGELRW
jgi:hypothetical protein